MNAIYHLAPAVKALLADPEILNLRGRVNAFEDAAGIKIGDPVTGRWDAAVFGEALRVVRDGGLEVALRRARDFRSKIREMDERLAQFLGPTAEPAPRPSVQT